MEKIKCIFYWEFSTYTHKPKKNSDIYFINRAQNEAKNYGYVNSFGKERNGKINIGKINIRRLHRSVEATVTVDRPHKKKKKLTEAEEQRI
jgi:hypothetical protein